MLLLNAIHSTYVRPRKRPCHFPEPRLQEIWPFGHFQPFTCWNSNDRIGRTPPAPPCRQEWSTILAILMYQSCFVNCQFWLCWLVAWISSSSIQLHHHPRVKDVHMYTQQPSSTIPSYSRCRGSLSWATLRYVHTLQWVASRVGICLVQRQTCKPLKFKTGAHSVQVVVVLRRCSASTGLTWYDELLRSVKILLTCTDKRLTKYQGNLDNDMVDLLIQRTCDRWLLSLRFQIMHSRVYETQDFSRCHRHGGSIVNPLSTHFHVHVLLVQW